MKLYPQTLPSLIACLAMAILTFYGGIDAAHASSVREVTWADLVPAMRNDLQKQAVALDKQLRDLPDETRDTYDKVALEMLLRDEIAAGQLKKSSLTERELRVLSENGMKKHPEITKFWREYENLRTAYEKHAEKVRPDLDDVDIRMPGYVLPLEFDGDKVTEFLLVPYVGACIHKPVPAPNQMVFVKAASPFKSEGLFSPVWVEGRMFAKSGVYNLSLVDGSRDVDSGYSGPRSLSKSSAIWADAGASSRRATRRIGCRMPLLRLPCFSWIFRAPRPYAGSLRTPQTFWRAERAASR
jgi:hypothetical protein